MASSNVIPSARLMMSMRKGGTLTSPPADLYVASVRPPRRLTSFIVRATLVVCGWTGAGCATSSSPGSPSAESNLGYQPLNRAALRISQPHTLEVQDLRPVSFGEKGSTISSYMGVTGAIGTALRTCSNETEVAEMKLEDPAKAIRAELGPRLSKRFSLQPPPPATTPDLVLEIATTSWMILSSGVGESSFRYEGSIKLTDRRRNAVLAEGVCKIDPIPAAGVRSCEDLVKNNGAALKESLKDVAQFCTEDYRTRLLGLY